MLPSRVSIAAFQMLQPLFGPLQCHLLTVVWTRPREIARLVRCLSCRHENLSLDPPPQVKSRCASA